MTDSTKDDTNPSIWLIFVTFLKLGCTAFGGPIAHIGFFRKEFVEQRKWLSDDHFSQLLAISQFLPGPASSQLGYSIGLLKGHWLGGIAAFTAFTLPSVILLLIFANSLSILNSTAGQAALHGLKLVAFAVVVDALLGMYDKLCHDKLRKSIALFTLVTLLLFGSSFFQLLAIALSACLGYYFIDSAPTSKLSLSMRYGKKTGLICLIIFVVLLFLLPLLANKEPTLTSISHLFYQAGALVFGGGHVVLPLLEESIVNQTQWLSQNQFLAGYGASQAIPGPMFAFSAYLGALIPTDGAALVSALVATLFMFLPGFLLMIGILPYWQSITSKPAAFGAIAGVNAAVVGILAAALYNPIFTTSINSGDELAIALISLALLRLAKISVLWVVAWSITASIVWLS
jgi:chromate transporter